MADILWQIYYGRCGAADISRQIHYGRHIKANMLRHINRLWHIYIDAYLTAIILRQIFYGSYIMNEWMIGRKQPVHFRQQGLQKANAIITKEAIPLINHEASHLQKRCPRAILWLAYRQNILSVSPGSWKAPSAHSANSPCDNGTAELAMSMGCVLVVCGHSNRSNDGTTQCSIAQCGGILVQPPYFDDSNMQQESPRFFLESAAEQQPFYSVACQAPGRYLSAEATWRTGTSDKVRKPCSEAPTLWRVMHF